MKSSNKGRQGTREIGARWQRLLFNSSSMAAPTENWVSALPLKEIDAYGTKL